MPIRAPENTTTDPTSGLNHPPATQTRPLVRSLYQAGVELLLAEHNHQYERFAPQTPDGERDDARGIRAS